MIMSKVEIFGERNPILKFSSKSDERFSNLHYVKDIWGHTHTHTHRDKVRERISWADGEMRPSHKALFCTS